MSDQYKSREERRKALAQTSKTKNKKPNKPERGSLFKRILFILVSIGLIGLIAGGVTFAVIAAGAPKLDEKKLKDSYSSTIYDKEGNEISEVGAQKRTYISYNDIPKKLEEAVLATEDARFYEHSGVDVIRLGGAVVANVTQGFGSQGGSTITQQVIKNSFFTHEKTITRKIQELWLAFQLEQKYSKHEILEMYLNKIYYHPQYYGVGKAAEGFYGKELKDLELHEAAMLAGIPQSPTNFDPRKNPESAEKRRNIVLNLMVKQGFITEQEAEEAKKVPVQSTVVPEREKSNPYSAYVEQVIEEVKDKTDIDASSAGAKIYTTIDTDAQNYVEELLNGSEIGYPDDNFQAGVTLIDTETGEIRAIGGGRNQNVGDFNYAIDTRRQPGSTIKPVLDYGPAIEYLKWSTYEQIKDEPYTYSNGVKINNFDRGYKGQMSIRDALAQSRNIPALKAMQEVGVDKARDFAAGLGIPLEEEIPEAYSIGGFDTGVSPLHMAGAFAAFGNNGIYTEPHAVTKVVLSDGTEIDLSPEPEAAMSDYTAYMTTDMMISVVEEGTGTAARVPGVTVAGKTGTTNFSEEDKARYNVPAGGAKDSWFVGYTPEYSAAVWTGYMKNDEKMHLTKTDQQLAKKIFKEVISEVSSGDGKDFKKPDSVVKITVEDGSNPPKLASKFTPDSKKISEYFVKGTEPTKVSEQYKRLAKPSGFKVDYDQTSNQITLSWDYKDDLKDAVSFEISQSVDDGPAQVINNTKDTGMVIPNAAAGSTYKFYVTAVSDDDGSNRSDSAAAVLKVPEAVIEEPVEPEEPPAEEPGEEPGEGELPPLEELPGEELPGEGEQPPGEETPGEGDADGGDNEGQPGEGETPQEPSNPLVPVPPANPPGNGNGNNGNGNGNGGNDDGDGSSDGD
ncbi:PBP1A family penicillin-binding protein [Peribacillus frigoritolerans]|uniref:PBP1A family penicillin-binding protein n=1 Tax=Peribacillus frigoritolerans TaxID=450367 RepID=UPI00105A756E|nr:PBP1A family penicillin-binding protein [Peribacillus frigoritolerans]TDL82614.1 PBP1A family penicillin-binding protein [Peribacillus frigoritolerans]